MIIAADVAESLRVPGTVLVSFMPPSDPEKKAIISISWLRELKLRSSVLTGQKSPPSVAKKEFELTWDSKFCCDRNGREYGNGCRKSYP